MRGVLRGVGHHQRQVLPDVLHDGDLLLMMGAGDIGYIAHRIATDGFAGNSPTTSSQICIASSLVMYCMNLTAASYFSPSALVVIALTQ